MLSSTSYRLSNLSPFIWKFVLFSYWVLFGPVASFKFINPILYDVKTVTLEIGSTVNYSIDCRTDDPNASTTLLFRSHQLPIPQELPVGDKVSLSKQVYTIHGLVLKDSGTYFCEATSSQGAGPIKRQLILFLFKEEIPCCPNVFPVKKVIRSGTSTSFSCKVDMKNSLPKYLIFKWYKQENGTFVEVPSSETHRRDNTTSVLMIKNAKATPDGGILYKCEMLYKKAKDSFTGPRLVVHDLRAPTITDLPGSVAVNEPKKLNMVRCRASGYPVPKITWIRNGTKLPVCVKTGAVDSCAGENYQVFEHEDEDRAFRDSYLTIVSTKYPRDHGKYTCLAKNTQTAQKDVEVSIQAPPVLDKTQRYWVKRQISCKVTRSSPLPTFKWQYQGGRCLNSNLECKPSNTNWQDITDNFVISPPVGMATARSRLTVPKDKPSAFFKCEATNVVGSDDKTMSFFASGIEAITMMLAPLEYDEDQTLKLRCVMLWKGSLIRWYKDDQRLTHVSDARVNITSAVESDRTWTELVVERLAANDSGLYSCGAEDTSGRRFNASNFIKISKVFPPTILGFKNQTVYRQTTVNLNCEITAHPTPKVKWLKNHLSLEDEIKVLPTLESCSKLVQGFYRVNDNKHVGLLVICYPSHARQTGFYTCQAENRKGKSNATAFLNVLEDPIIVSPSAEFASKPVLVELGKPWNATCKATGNPLPSVEWRREKGNTSVTEKLRDSKGVVLPIRSVSQDDLGIYICVAENSKALKNRSVELVSVNPIPSPQPSEGLAKEAVIALSVVGGILFLLFLLAITCGIFIRHQRKQLREYRSQFFPEYIGEHELDPDRTLLEQCNNLPYDPIWEFPEDRLTLGEVLGAGAFGQVIKAEAIGIADFSPRDKSVEKVGRRRSRMRWRSSSNKLYRDTTGVPYTKTTVAVKTLKVGATVEEYRDLASELKILIHVGEHTNIVNLLGACTKGERLLVIMEYAPHGNLLKFLRGKRDVYEPTWTKTTNNPELEFTIAHLVNYCYQICRGMEFLGSKKCIHRDLAARNVLVGEDYIMKVADFGLARDIYKSDLYVKTTSGVLPVKWMALESLFLREYSEKSDIWSYGICLWEIFTLGGTPYPGIPMEQLLDFLSDGHRMEQPQNCPLEIYTIMRDCWLKESDQRPKFVQLSERIGRILESEASKQESSAYARLTEDSMRGRKDYYLVPLEPGSAMRQSEDAGYNRQSSEDIAHSPLPPLPRDAEHGQDPEHDERQRMLEHEASGSLSTNESGIELEEAGDEMAAAMELRPVVYSTERARKESKSKQTFV